MDPEPLKALSDDIAVNGLRDPITLTPDDRLLDGRNRVLACLMAGVEIPPGKIEVYDGDPWLFSISRNARRRHMSVDEIAMRVAKMPMKQLGTNQFNEGGSNEPPSTAEAAKAAGIPETAIKSAKTVLARGTEEQKAAAAKKGGLRKTAEAIRARERKTQLGKTPPADPIGAIVKALRKEFEYAPAQWRSISKTARYANCADSALEEVLSRLGDAVERNSEGRWRFKSLFAQASAGAPAASAKGSDEPASDSALREALQKQRDEFAKALRAKDGEVADLKAAHARQMQTYEFEHN
jgi:hypothetical protein